MKKYLLLPLVTLVFVRVLGQLAISDYTVTGLMCHGYTNGSIFIIVSGGTAPYTYRWSNSDTTSFISNLAANNYTVTVTDAATSTVTASYTVTSPAAIIDSIFATSASCNSGGSATIMVSGGTGPYAYHWSNGASSNIISGDTSGVYSVTVMDAYNCSTTAVTTINPGPSPITVGSVGITRSTACYGDSITGNGAINLSINGGNPPFQYRWSNGATVQNPTNLAAKIYEVTVADVFGCFFLDTFTVTTSTVPFTASFTLLQDSSVAHDWYLLYTYSGSVPVSYEWNWGDGNTSSGPYPSHVYSDSGYYDICITLTDSSGCVAHHCDSSTYLRSTEQLMIDVNVVAQLPTGLGTMEENNFVLYPNPAENTLHLNTSLSGNIQYQIFNSVGVMVIQERIASGYFDINLNNFSKGVCLIKLKNESEEVVQRFVKQ